jgi:glycerol-3-phosphate dehydrogenase
LIGVWHRPFPDVPDTARVEPAEIHAWVAELNSIHPALELSPSEVTFVHCGLVPLDETATDAQPGSGGQSRIVDHRAAHGIANLVSLTGIRFTAARADAARALEILLQQFPARTTSAATARLPLPGGNIHDFAAFEAHARRAMPHWMDPQTLQSLLRNYGTEYRSVIGDLDTSDAQTSMALVPGTKTLLAEIDHAVAQEMAVRLEDVVLRRTDIAAGRHPGRAALEATAAAMASRLGWSQARTSEEIEMTERVLSRHLARDLSPASNPGLNAAVSATGRTFRNGAMLAKESRMKATHSSPQTADTRQVQTRA